MYPCEIKLKQLGTISTKVIPGFNYYIVLKLFFLYLNIFSRKCQVLLRIGYPVPMQSKDGGERVGSNLVSVFASIPVIGLKFLCAHFRFNLCTFKNLFSFLYMNILFDRFCIYVLLFLVLNFFVNKGT